MMNETEKKIEVMKAFTEGKKIQYKAVDETKWHDVVKPLWEWGSTDYRVKPETKYRPYKDTDEMIADFDARFHSTNVPKYAIRLIWVQVKDTGFKALIIGYGANGVETSDLHMWTMDELFDMFTYLDGTPCGKLVEK